MNASTSLENLQATAGNLPSSVPLQQAPRDVAVVPGFNSAQGWDLAQRIGKAFSASDLVPQQYRGNLANCIVALEMSNRMGASPLQVMQNLYIVHGNPGWSSKFLIACFNQSGKYTALRYDFERDANGDAVSCRAWAIERHTNEKLVGAKITLDMAKNEGWSTKSGSKWKTMPEQMLMYRAAAFFIRAYAPEISMGLNTSEELYDMPAQNGVSISEMQTIEAQPVIEEKPKKAATKPAHTYESIEAAMKNAKSLAELDDAKDLVSNIADEAQRMELNKLYFSREADFSAAQ